MITVGARVRLWQWAGRPQLRPRSRRWLLLLQLALPPAWWNKVAFLRGANFSLLPLFVFRFSLSLVLQRPHFSMDPLACTGHGCSILTPALWTVACGWAIGMACSYFCYTSPTSVSLPAFPQFCLVVTVFSRCFHVFCAVALWSCLHVRILGKPNEWIDSYSELQMSCFTQTLYSNLILLLIQYI